MPASVAQRTHCEYGRSLHDSFAAAKIIVELQSGECNFLNKEKLILDFCRAFGQMIIFTFYRVVTKDHEANSDGNEHNDKNPPLDLCFNRWLLCNFMVSGFHQVINRQWCK